MNDVNHNDCAIIKDMYKRFMAGESPEDIVPYDISYMSEQCQQEMLSFYVKYGKDPGRVEICRRRLYR